LINKKGSKRGRLEEKIESRGDNQGEERKGKTYTMVTMGGDLQPGCLADRLLTGLGQPQINP
jgi:hypothetical protein